MDAELWSRELSKQESDFYASRGGPVGSVGPQTFKLTRLTEQAKTQKLDPAEPHN